MNSKGSLRERIALTVMTLYAIVGSWYVFAMAASERP